MNRTISVSESIENAERTVERMSVFGWRLVDKKEISVLLGKSDSTQFESEVVRRYVRLTFERDVNE